MRPTTQERAQMRKWQTYVIADSEILPLSYNKQASQYIY
jgi:hypothetical protein